MIYPDLTYERALELIASPSSQFMELDGMRVHYEKKGEGVPILLLHGNGSSLRAWDEWVPALIENGFCVVRLDLPGCGLTGAHPHDDYQIETYVQFLNRFMDQLEIESTWLVGNSLGGQIAWNFAAQFSSRVKGMILIAASGYPGGQNLPSIKLAQNSLGAFIIRKFTPQWLVRKSLSQNYGDPKKITAEKTQLWQNTLRAPGNRRAFVIRANTKRPENTQDLLKITAPAYVLWGSLDRVNPLPHAHQFVRDLPNAVVKVYEGVGHLPHEEHARKAVADVIQWISSTSKG